MSTPPDPSTPYPVRALGDADWEQFLATDKEGNPKQWDPADIGRIVNRYVFLSENPGIDAQRRA